MDGQNNQNNMYNPNNTYDPNMYNPNDMYNQNMNNQNMNNPNNYQNSYQNNFQDNLNHYYNDNSYVPKENKLNTKGSFDTTPRYAASSNSKPASGKVVNDKAVVSGCVIAVAVAAVIGLFILIGGILIVKKIYDTKKPKITSEMISETLSTSSELTSAKDEYNGVVHFEEGSIPLLTQHSFDMHYTSYIRAGIDVSEIESTVTDDEVVITIPHAQVQDITVDNSSIQFTDNTNSIMSLISDDKQDMVDSVNKAIDDTRENANIKGLLETADTQNEKIVRKLIQPMIGERELIIEFE